MALVLQGSISDEQVRLFFDIVANQVRGAQLVNESSRSVRLVLDRARGNRNIEVTVAPGETLTRTFPGSQRFDFDVLTADWSWSLGWAD